MVRCLSLCKRRGISVAAENGYEGVVQPLLACDDIDMNLNGKNGQTPLLFRAKKGYEGVCYLH